MTVDDRERTHLLGGYDQAIDEWVCHPACWCRSVKE